MARLPRLTLPGQCHWLIQPAHQALTPFVDETDRQTYLAALQEGALQERVQLHACALGARAVHLLATPAQHESLGRLMQTIGRRYVSAYHRRHGGSGTLWNGRYRSALVEPGSTLLDVLCLIDALAEGETDGGREHRSAGQQAPWLTDPPEYWALGNTPFDRQAAWRSRLAEGLRPEVSQALLKAAMGGWVVGSTAFTRTLASTTERPVAPRLRGRPPSKAV
jgi:putative transposase